MGELMVINPRDSKGRFVRRGARGAHKKRRKNDPDPARHKKRAHAKHHGKHRRRHNPARGLALPRMFGLDLQTAMQNGFLGLTGAVGAELGTELATKVVPVAQLQTGPGRMLLKGGVVIAGTALARGLLGAKITNPLLVGGMIGIGIDAYNAWLRPAIAMLPALGELSVSDIEERLDGLERVDERYGPYGSFGELQAWESPWVQ